MRINWYQGRVLADRYLEMILADYKNTLLLLAQAPVLAGMAVIVWLNTDRASPSLYFVMVLSAFWLGCMNACREIVKERALFLRERMVNLEVGAYLYSKVRILVLLDVVQVFTYVAILYAWLDVRVAVGWAFLTLLFTSVCGTCLGLMLSAMSKRSDYAVGAVPLVVLPQILFSEFVIDKDSFSGISEYIYMAMPSRWGYESLVEFAQTQVHYGDALVGFPVLLLLGGVCLGIAVPFLKWQRY